MARTRRRYDPSYQQTKEVKTTYRAGIYMRLSDERTESYREKSYSIETQEIICRDYAKEHGITVSKVYVDYEKTGTNFNRSGYQEMMADVRSNAINCIMIRDLSRLGREHLEMGRLIDKVFPILGVRFISVSDKLDTENGMTNDKSFEVILKNIINDMYSKDMSQKIKSTKMNKVKQGYFIGSVPPYGYQIKKEAGGQVLVVDEEIREVIEYIYDQTLKGATLATIARNLNLKGITPPMVYYKTKRKYRVDTDKEWYTGAIHTIIHNEVYCGTLIQGKKSQSLANHQQQVFVDKKDWVVFENRHEAIIKKEDFQAAQELKKQDPRNVKSTIDRPEKDPDNRYEGLIFAKKDGARMYRSYRYKDYGDYGRVYFFKTKINRASVKKAGKEIYINEETIDKLVMVAIGKLLHKTVDQRVFLEESNRQVQIRERVIDDVMAKLTNRITYHKGIQREFYECYVLGHLTKDEFLKRKLESVNKAKILQDEIAGLKEQKKELKTKQAEVNNFIKNLYKAPGKVRLDKELTQSLIERIEIGENKEITLIFRCKIE